MTPSGRDWDKELAEIDKVIARSPGPSAPPAAAPAGTPAARPSRAPGTRRAALGTWFQVLLGGLLAAGMTQWPYAHSCGLALFLYLGAAGLVVIAGIWAAVTSWRRSMGLAHVAGLLVMLAGLVLVAAAVLPRVGYARDTLPWLCS